MSGMVRMTVLVSKDMEAARDDSSGVSRYGAVRDNGSGVSRHGDSGIADKARGFVLKLHKLIVLNYCKLITPGLLYSLFAAMALSDEKGGCTKRKGI